MSRLVVFDTWTLNCDRHHPDSTMRRPNYDNVFVAIDAGPPEALVLKAIDHTHCFTCGEDLNHGMAGIDRVQDARIYGKFPGFLPHLNGEEVRRALRDIRGIERAEIEEFVGSVPTEWEVDDQARQAWINLIRQRAMFITDRLEDIAQEILVRQ